MPQVIRKLKNDIVGEGNISDYIALALAYGNQFKYESAARALLCTQNSEASDHKQINRTNYCSNLQIIIPCGGNAKRWENFLFQPKHLVYLDKQTRLLEKTRQQISTYLGDGKVSLLLDRKSSEKYPVFPKTNIIYKDNSNEYNVGLEVLKHPSINKSLDLLWIYGDTYFTDNAFNIIATDIANNRSRIRYYGRKRQNPDYGNNGGELFAIHTPSSLLEELKQIYQFVNRLYIGTPMYRFSSWEVVAFLSALLLKHSIQDWRNFVQHKGASNIFIDMCSVWESRSFSEEIWVEINDETEDFDYPIEYLNWLSRRAHARVSKSSIDGQWSCSLKAEPERD